MYFVIIFPILTTQLIKIFISLQNRIKCSDTKYKKTALDITRAKLNRLKMRIYRDKGMSESQRQKVKEYDWKKAAARRLQLKCDKIAKKECDKSRKRKSRAKLKVPTSPQKYAKHVEKVVKLAQCDPVKSAILVKCLDGTNILKNVAKPLSVLELQSLKRKNRIQEHSALVDKFRNKYGSLRQASKSLNVHWKTFHHLCQPLAKKKKEIRDSWVDIKTFYERDYISQELPSIQCQGRCYMTKTLEESYHAYVEDCLKHLRSTCHFHHLHTSILQKCTQ